ncbi:hypothetical protein ABE66_17275 [Cytobacillus firmus]|nr:hypothetical protein [Cytobacillus firmus]
MIRTESAGKTWLESEPRPTSDKKSRKARVRVRTRDNFGHIKQESASYSPNPGQLRTKKAGKRELESEPGTTSDTKGRKARVRVRTWDNFGHKRQESAS